LREILLEGDKLKEILPQKERMALLDRLVSVNKEARTAESEVDICRNNLFFDCDLGGVPSWIGIEMIAQTVAASSAVMSAKTKAGMVLSVNNYSAKEPLFFEGDTLKIQVREDFVSEPIFRYEGTIYREEKELVRSKITVVQGDFNGQ